MMAGTKYGIKLAATEYEPGRKKIEAITRFPSGNLLPDFMEITERQYNDYVLDLSIFHYYDSDKETVLKDEAAELAHEEAAELTALRARLKTLHYEIEFTNEISEDATDLENEFATLLNDYNNLKGS